MWSRESMIIPIQEKVYVHRGILMTLLYLNLYIMRIPGCWNSTLAYSQLTSLS